MFFYESNPQLDEDLFDFTESDRRFLNLSQRYNKKVGLKTHKYIHFTCMLQKDDFKIATKELFVDIIDVITLRSIEAVSIY